MLHRMLAMSVLFLLPSVCFAAVEINEIAWMGTSAGSSNEWIELHNTGNSDVTLSGWKIVSVPAKISIALTGSIAADGYYLIERSNDNVIPEIPADLIASFSTGLSNDGMTLNLLDASGAVVDEVIGGVSWKNIGGSVSSKETAQRSTSGWVTAAGTPGAPTPSSVSDNTSGDNTTPVIESSATNTPDNVQDITVSGTSSGSASATNKTTVTRESYRIVVHSNERIYKDIPTALRASVSGLHDEMLPDAVVTWNFGDGAVATGTAVTHTYRFPGTYPVIVTAAYKGLSTQVRARAQVIAQDVHIVTALPGIDGYVSIISPVDIDISGWTLRDGNVSFAFPPQTQLFGKVAATFPNAITGMYVQQTLALFRADGRLMSAVGSDDEAELVVDSYPSAQLALARSALQPPVLGKAATTTATSLGDWSMSSVTKGFRFPVWGYWVLAAFFVGAAGLIIALSKGFNPNREVDAEAEKYTFIELDSNLEDIT